MGRISLPHPKKIVDSAGNAFYIIHQSYVQARATQTQLGGFFYFYLCCRGTPECVPSYEVSVKKQIIFLSF